MMNASVRVGKIVPDEVIAKVDNEVRDHYKDTESYPSVNLIQSIVLSNLMEYDEEVYKSYNEYKSRRDKARDDDMNKKMREISNVVASNILNENANMDGSSPSGQMMKYASMYSQKYALDELLNPEHSQMHKDGTIHIHDLDYYPTKSLTCLQYDLIDLFKGGFETRHGHIREPKRIESYASLAAIAFQTCQNVMHGGQSIPAFDFMMAPGVVKSFKAHFRDVMWQHAEYSPGFAGVDEVLGHLESMQDIDSDNLGKLESLLVRVRELSKSGYSDDFDNHFLIDRSLDLTKKSTMQAMESFINNMNSMHSRGGNQVVFSSINYGTDTSKAGRMVIDCVLEATKSGLGKGEIPIFPIQIYKCKNGVSYDRDRLREWIKSKETGSEFFFTSKDFQCNLDLMIKACEVASLRLFPNFLNLDASYNQHEKWDINDPERWRYEVATMGCRTRVFENVNGEKTSVGRGNLSFTTINLVRLAIEAKSLEEFYESLESVARSVGDQLYDRYQYQRTALARQFGFMTQNRMWVGSEGLRPHDEVGDTIDTGTLGIGFIGGANAIRQLIGESVVESQEARDLMTKILDILNKVANEYKERYSLNYSVLATPAEGLSGRFTTLDRDKYGVIEGVTDRDYYINSFHIDVKEKVSIVDKILIESEWHEKCGGGHITYVELDGSLKGNTPATAKIVLMMMSTNGGYFSLNYPSDTCRTCGFDGVIGDYCPKCEGESIRRIRRITGYLVGEMGSWNSFKVAEERDRVKHLM
jgi:ribonucleoside-triphosphate reductase